MKMLLIILSVLLLATSIIGSNGKVISYTFSNVIDIVVYICNSSYNCITGIF